MLDAPFSDKEIYDHVMGSYGVGAPGPHGFSLLYYKKWLVVKDDFLVL